MSARSEGVEALLRALSEGKSPDRLANYHARDKSRDATATYEGEVTRMHQEIDGLDTTADEQPIVQFAKNLVEFVAKESPALGFTPPQFAFTAGAMQRLVQTLAGLREDLQKAEGQ